MATQDQKDTSHPAPQRNGLRIIFGLILVIPAMLSCGASLLVPTISTISMSFQRVNLPSRQAQWVGAENYARLLQDSAFTGALGFTLALMVMRLLVVAVLPLLLAAAVNAFGGVVRIAARLLFTIPLSLFMPVIVALAWMLALAPNFGFLAGARSPLTNADQARWILLLIDGLTTLGLACGIGLVFYLAALRGAGEATRKPLVLTWLIGMLATAALALQSFTLSYMLTSGGPRNATLTLAFALFNQAFRNFNFGGGAAIATLMLLYLAVVGLGVGIIVVFAGLRLEVAAAAESSGQRGKLRRLYCWHLRCSSPLESL